jgi:chromosome partitioning protein
VIIIVFASAKGGVGKSAAALATAGLLARHYRTTFIDLDPDGYATTMGLGESAVFDPLVAAPIAITHRLLTGGGSLHLLPSGERLDLASEPAIAAHIKRGAALADVVVVDTPPDRRRPTVTAALRAASVVVVPVLPEYQALSGLERLMETTRHLGVRAPIRALLVRWEPRTVLAQDVQRQLVTEHPGLAVSAIVPKDQRVAEAPAAGLPVTLYAPRSTASLAHRTATYEIAATAGLTIPKGAF